MKKLLLTLLALLVSTGAYAQCTPSTTVSKTINTISPGLATAQPGVTYTTTTHQVVLKRDTTVAISAGGQTSSALISYYRVILDSVSGFPAGLPTGATNSDQLISLYATLRNSTTFNFDRQDPADTAQVGCFELDGTPTTAGTYTGVLHGKGRAKCTISQQFYSLATGLCSGLGSPLSSPTFDLDTIPACFTNPIVTGTFDPRPLANTFKNPSFWRMRVQVGGSTSIAPGLVEANLSLYPNPTLSASSLRFTLTQAQTLKIEVMDVTGRTHNTLTANYAAGTHAVELPTTNLESGVYLVRTTIGNHSQTLKLVRN
jgi:hypothetical protein